jgi:hypothetical protein
MGGLSMQLRFDLALEHPMTSLTELRVVDVARLSRTDTRIVSVEIVKGEPSLNMQFTSPDAPGRWQIVGFGTMPAQYLLSHPNAMNLSIVNLEEGNEIPEGIILVEAK